MLPEKEPQREGSPFLAGSKSWSDRSRRGLPGDMVISNLVLWSKTREWSAASQTYAKRGGDLHLISVRASAEHELIGSSVDGSCLKNISVALTVALFKQNLGVDERAINRRGSSSVAFLVSIQGQLPA